MTAAAGLYLEPTLRRLCLALHCTAVSVQLAHHCRLHQETSANCVSIRRLVKNKAHALLWLMVYLKKKKSCYCQSRWVCLTFCKNFCTSNWRKVISFTQISHKIHWLFFDVINVMLEWLKNTDRLWKTLKDRQIYLNLTDI